MFPPLILGLMITPYADGRATCAALLVADPTSDALEKDEGVLEHGDALGGGGVLCGSVEETLLTASWATSMPWLPRNPTSSWTAFCGGARRGY